MTAADVLVDAAESIRISVTGGGSPDTLVGSDAFDTLDDNAGSDLVDNTFEFVADWIDAA